VIQIGNALRGVRPWRAVRSDQMAKADWCCISASNRPPSCARARGQGRARTWPVRSVSGREYRSVRVSDKSLPGRCFFRPAISQPQRTDHAAARAPMQAPKHQDQLIGSHLRKGRRVCLLAAARRPQMRGHPLSSPSGGSIWAPCTLSRHCAVAAREWGCHPCQWLSSVRRYRVPSEQICVVTDSGESAAIAELGG
jgi:hypothetical protein